MSLVDLFDRFNAKPVTCTWLIDKFLDTFSDRISPETKLSFSAFNLHLNKKGDFFNITFAARANIPAFYYRISVIDKQGQKWNTQVVIEDMSAAAAEELLKFIYTGKVKDLDEHVHELYSAADKYQIDSLKSYCELYLAKSLSASTVPKTLQLAELYSLGDLKSKCIHYIIRHATEFKFDDWKELTTNHLESMYKVFQIHGRKFK